MYVCKIYRKATLRATVATATVSYILWKLYNGRIINSMSVERGAANKLGGPSHVHGGRTQAKHVL